MDITSADFTILLRTKNSEKTLPQTLSALKSQNIKPQKILCTDSGSTDSTHKILDFYGIDYQVIEPQDYLPGKVLNNMMQKVKTPYVIFLNSDAISLTPSTFENLLRPLKSSKVGATFARQLPRLDAQMWVKRDYEKAFPDAEKAPPFQSISFCLAAIKTEVWKKFRFYENAFGSEDQEFAKKIDKEIVYVKDALCEHSHNYTLKGLFGRRFIEGEADGFIEKKPYSFFSFLKAFFKSATRDFFLYLSHGEIIGAFFNIARRFVFWYAYYKGRKLGINRFLKNNKDPSQGQKTVLSRYE